MPFISGVKCERCGRTSYYKSIRTKKELTQDLRKLGWSIGKGTKCPNCRRGSGMRIGNPLFRFSVYR